MDLDLLLKVVGSVLGSVLLLGGTWLTVRQARKQQTDTNVLDRWDKFTGRLESNVDNLYDRHDALQVKYDKLYTDWELERKLRLAFQEYTQRTFGHFRKHPKCEEEIGPLPRSLKSYIDS